MSIISSAKELECIGISWGGSMMNKNFVRSLYPILLGNTISYALYKCEKSGKYQLRKTIYFESRTRQNQLSGIEFEFFGISKEVKSENSYGKNWSDWRCDHKKLSKNRFLRSTLSISRN